MEIIRKIPKAFSDTKDEINTDMQNFLFAYNVLSVIIGTDFTKRSILKATHKISDVENILEEQLGYIPKDNKIASKPTMIIALIYILNKKGVNTFNNRVLYKEIKEILGYNFLSKINDFGTWLSALAEKEYITRNRIGKRTEIRDGISKVLDSAFESGSFKYTLLLNNGEN